MLEPWNDARILPPPVHTFKCDFVIDVKQLQYVCNSLMKILSKQSPLHREAALCSRLLYKFDKKFRNDIGYRYLKKVNTALRKYLVLNLFKVVDNFLCALPSEDDEFYLPTRQMLEFVMLRLMAFSKVMIRVCVCSKQASVFYLDRVKRGESHWMSLIPYALLCRIWSICMVLLKHSCSWYTNFYPFLEKLQLKGLNLLPEDYKLPSNIKEWLDVDNLDNFAKFNWTQKKQAQFELLLVEDDEGDILGNILEFVSQINSADEEEQEMKPLHTGKITDLEQLHSNSLLDQGEKISRDMLKNSNTILDQGEKISRDMFKRSNTISDQGEKISRDMFKSFYRTTGPKIQHSAERVTNKDTLHQFITLEEKYRNESSKQSLTNHLSFMQWQALKNSLQSLYDSLAKNRKIEKKFKKLWKEKCLDYK